ncbi:MAG TPA: hypothetical protein EYP53_08060 [Candidatus Latescibacteria bacterium]|nr:hypothetical protein [Candidatus Latescibacterota bacterium]
MIEVSRYRPAFKPDLRYAYATGRIRALESRQLRRQDIERLIEVRHPEEAVRILTEGGYGGELPRLEGWSDFEYMLEIQQRSVIDLLSELSKDTSISDLFLERYDFYNLKVLLKAKYSHQDLDHLLIGIGRTSIDLLKKAVMESDYRGVSGAIKDIIGWVDTVWEGMLDPQLIDVAVDNRMYDRFLSIVVPFGNRFLHDWLRLEIDLANLRTFLRLKWLGLEDIMDQVLVKGGTIEELKFLSLRGESWERVIEAFRKTGYADVVAEGVGHLLDASSFSRLESLSDGLIISFLRRAKLQPFGIEPLIAYVLLREYEFKAVRAIVVGKMNGVADDLIRERVVNGYV